MKPSFFSLSHFSAAVAGIVVSYGSGAIIIYQAALAMGSTPEQINSWFTALGIACGVLTIGLSWYYKTPIMAAWCTPCAALMASMQGAPLPEAIGAFMVSSALMLIVTLSGLFGRLVNLIPRTLACAMLAGILLNFGASVFTAMQNQTLLITLMLMAYFISKIRMARYSLLMMLVVGLACAHFLGLLQWEQLQWQAPTLVWTTPAFSVSTIISITTPLFITSLVTQNVPGMAILRMHHYQAPAKPIISSMALLTVLMAPLGVYKVNLAAISSAITMGPDVDPDPARRYRANFFMGLFYLGTGLLGGMVVSLFATLPKALLVGLAGIAIFGTLLNNLVQAWEDNTTREASLITFLMSASGISLLGIGSAFWGLMVGLMVYHWYRYIERARGA